MQGPPAPKPAQAFLFTNQRDRWHLAMKDDRRVEPGSLSAGYREAAELETEPNSWGRFEPRPFVRRTAPPFAIQPLQREASPAGPPPDSNPSHGRHGRDHSL